MKSRFGIVWTKLQAGSLQFVLFIGAVIAVLLLTFVLLAHSHFLFATKTDKYVELVKHTDRAIQLSLMDSQKNTSNGIQMPEDDGITTTIEEKDWGIYKIISATSTFQKKNFKKIVLTGNKLLDPESVLFLKDNNRPMVIAGKSKIIGDAYLPKQGIRMGNIGGQSFYGTTPIQGKQHLSISNIPEMNSTNRNAIQQLLLMGSGVSNSQGLSTSLQQLEITNSFFEPTRTIDADVLDLSGKKISGNVVIRSSYQIRINASSQLKDVILVAPKIIIGDGVVGNFQAIASKEIQVGRNCNLKYPTALVILQKSNTTPKKNSNYASQPPINIESNSFVHGSLCYLNSDNEQVYHPQIRIAETAIVVGQVYCQKNLELKGKVLGNVTTSGFVALENGNVYQNHLFNGSMDVSMLPLEYVGMSFGNEAKKGVAKCLY